MMKVTSNILRKNDYHVHLFVTMFIKLPVSFLLGTLFKLDTGPESNMFTPTFRKKDQESTTLHR